MQRQRSSGCIIVTSRTVSGQLFVLDYYNDLNAINNRESELI
jgi:hypothetical protein